MFAKTAPETVMPGRDEEQDDDPKDELASMYRIIACVLFAILTLDATSVAQGPARIILLKNDGLLRGDVRADADMLLVRLAGGGEVRLRPEKVLAVFPSMEQAFAWRKARIGDGDDRRLVSLAYWALRHDYPEGALEIWRRQTARGSHDDRLKALERELQRLATRQPPQPPRLSARHRLSRFSPSQLAPASRVRFHRDIEPILLRRCGNSGCHGPGGDFAFRLVQPHPSERQGALDRISHNLRTTLHQVDREMPRQSRLLAWAARTHRPDMKSPPLARSDPDYQRIALWLDTISDSRTEAPARRLPAQADSAVLLQHPPVQAATMTAEPVSSPAASRDPYDPDLFNSGRR